MSFREFAVREGLSLDQIFNFDKTGLYYRLLPERTLATAFAKTADGRKRSKDRVTLGACSNASGSVKLPLFMIGKSSHPRCLKDINTSLLPFIYVGQRNAWMDTEIFTQWFHTRFVKSVRAALIARDVEPKALLLLDNCSAHPSCEELTSDDRQIRAMFLPPNVTSLIQLIDQGVLISIKRHYKKKLLQRLIVGDEEGTKIPDFLRRIDMKNAGEMSAQAWKENTPTTLRKSWQKIFPILPSESSFDEHSYSREPNEDSDDI